MPQSLSDLFSCKELAITEGKLPFMASIDTLTPEFRLAATVSWLPSAALAETHKESIKELCGQVQNWDNFLMLIDRHRIPALACANLVDFSHVVPVTVLVALKLRNHQARFHALAHAAEFVRLSKIFNSQGIPCLPLKGPMLSVQLYNDPGVRQVHDLDILIQRDDLKKAETLLLAEGYHRITPRTDLSGAPLRFIISVNHHFGYQHRKRGILLELHWRDTFLGERDIMAFWESNATIVFAGSKYQALNDDVQLLYLCGHGSRHRWFRLKWLGDIGKIVAEERISSWEKVIALAKESGQERSLALGVLLIDRILLIPLPEALSQFVKEVVPYNLVPKVIEAMLGNEEEVNDAIKHFTFQKRLDPSLPIRTMVQDVLVSMDDFKLVHFSGPFFWLYIPLRPFFWFWRHNRWLMAKTRHHQWLKAKKDDALNEKQKQAFN